MKMHRLNKDLATINASVTLIKNVRTIEIVVNTTNM